MTTMWQQQHGEVVNNDVVCQCQILDVIQDLVYWVSSTAGGEGGKENNNILAEFFRQLRRV